MGRTRIFIDTFNSNIQILFEALESVVVIKGLTAIDLALRLARLQGGHPALENALPHPQFDTAFGEEDLN